MRLAYAGSVRRAIWLAPLFGTVVFVLFPLVRYVEQRRHEERAIDVLQQLRGSQEVFRQLWGGYATDMASLEAPCGGLKPAFDRVARTGLEENGYRMSLRAARGAEVLDRRDCRGRAVATDFYVAAEPIDAREAGQQAFASRASGEIHVFYDGLAPDEADIAAGLSTPLSRRGSFRIP
jgi:hypothetical protein